MSPFPHGYCLLLATVAVEAPAVQLLCASRAANPFIVAIFVRPEGEYRRAVQAVVRTGNAKCGCHGFQLSCMHGGLGVEPVGVQPALAELRFLHLCTLLLHRCGRCRTRSHCSSCLLRSSCSTQVRPISAAGQVCVLGCLRVCAGRTVSECQQIRVGARAALKLLAICPLGMPACARLPVHHSEPAVPVLLPFHR